VVGVDVPLGWPVQFVHAVASHGRGDAWPALEASDAAARESLRYRATDLHLRGTGHRPLSVSTDLIGVVALRAARIQHLLQAAGHQVDRSGVAGCLVEVYPAAALRTWGLPARGYKGAGHRDALASLTQQIASLTGQLTASASTALAGCSDHQLDAFLCALIATASRLGMTEPPGPDQLALAQAEGWIHVPTSPLVEIVATALR
jgi:predicted nuclease with RNAse H fold